MPLDPSLPRTDTVECEVCGHDEAVYFMAHDNEKDDVRKKSEL